MPNEMYKHFIWVSSGLALVFNLISVLGCWPGVDFRIAVKQPEVCFVKDFNRVAAWLGNNTDVIETSTYFDT